MVTTDKQWRAGYAEAEITPAPGHAYMAGYGRERYADGALQPLLAQVLALQDAGGSTAVIIAADICCFDPTTVQRLRRALRERYKLRPQSVLFAASHTHWGPAVGYGFTFSVGAPNVWYLQRLEDLLLETAGRALTTMSAAQLQYAAAEAQIGHNRRLPDGAGGIGWGVNVAGGYDRHTPVLRIARREAPREIVLVSHGCHPTSSGTVDKWFPDYPGAMRDELVANLGPESRAIFAMGCGADTKTTRRHPETGELQFLDSPELAKVAGCRLAAAVLAVLQGDSMQPLAAELQCRAATGGLTFGKRRSRRELERLAYGDGAVGQRWWARQMLAYPSRQRSLTYEVQAWRLGSLTLVALAGEVCHALGPLVRSLSPARETMVIAYANGSVGYIPDRKVFAEGGYEGESSHMAYFLPAPFTAAVETEFTSIVKRALHPA